MCDGGRFFLFHFLLSEIYEFFSGSFFSRVGGSMRLRGSLIDEGVNKDHRIRE